MEEQSARVKKVTWMYKFPPFVTDWDTGQQGYRVFMMRGMYEGSM